MGSAKVIGVHPVEADQPCHLVELLVRDPCRTFKVDDIAQVSDADRGYWQAAYDEQFLDAQSCQPLTVQAFASPERNEYPLAFFFHYLDLAKPLESSFGPLALPSASPRPHHLAFMVWGPP